ncbi:MAG: hypothetical protein AB9869_34900 [Verrucomicrobiia bacterium]
MTPPDCVDRLTGLSTRITLAGVEPDYTRTQGQYLAFIYYCTKRRLRAEKRSPGRTSV